MDDVLSRSLYVLQMRAWLAAFDCRNFMILRFEAHLHASNSTANTYVHEATLHRITAWLAGAAVRSRGVREAIERTQKSQLRRGAPLGSSKLARAIAHRKK